MRLEDSLNGGYAGLFGEITDKDVFHLRDVADIVSVNDPSFVHEAGHNRGFDFYPDVIFDLGANIGIFTRYARQLYPGAFIVAVEPDWENRMVFMEHTLNSNNNLRLIGKAIGTGQIYHCPGAVNGAGEVYISESPGYPKGYLGGDQSPACSTPSMMLYELEEYLRPGQRTILKMDIEGSETVVFADNKSMDFLKKIDYFVIELHYYSADQETNLEVQRVTEKAISQLYFTHDMRREGNYLYGLKK